MMWAAEKSVGSARWSWMPMAISGHAATSLGNGGGRSRRWETELGGGGGPHGAAGGLRPQPEKPRARPWGGLRCLGCAFHAFHSP